jgi:hypothetical protein
MPNPNPDLDPKLRPNQGQDNKNYFVSTTPMTGTVFSYSIHLRISTFLSHKPGQGWGLNESR